MESKCRADKIRKTFVAILFSSFYVVILIASATCSYREVGYAVSGASALWHNLNGMAAGRIPLSHEAIVVTGSCILRVLLFIPAGLFGLVAVGAVMTAARTIFQIFSRD